MNYVFSFTLVILVYFTLFYLIFFLYFFFIFLLCYSVFPPFWKKKYSKYSSKRFRFLPGLAPLGTSTAHCPKETLPLSNGKGAAPARVPPAREGVLWAISLEFVSL